MQAVSRKWKAHSSPYMVPDKTEIDSWTSSDKPHRVEHLAPGTYSLREMMSPRTYDLAEEITFEIKDTGEVQSVAMKDAPIEIKGQVDKRQELVQPIEKGLLANGDGKNRAAMQTNTDGLFSYTIDARNDSTTWVDEFTITDDLECAEDDTARFVSTRNPRRHRRPQRSVQRVVSHDAVGLDRRR